MTEIKKRDVLDALISADLAEEALYESYSGRGMYGDKCFGIIGSTRDLLHFFVSLIEEHGWGVYGDTDETDTRISIVRELADVVQSDNMGTDTIFYFPGFTLSE